MGDELITTGPAALRVGILASHMQKLCKKGLVPAVMVGNRWAIRVSDLPTIREAAVKAGYLKPEAAHAAG